ncbi:EamA family transporter [Paenibacillus macerans]
MLSYIILCAVIWTGTYTCLSMPKQPVEVKPVRSIEDLFE